MTKNQRQIKISDEEIDALIKKMESLPPKPQATNGMRDKSEVLAKLAPTIKQMLQRGYSIKSVADFLKEQKIEVSLVTLSKATKPRRRRKQDQPSEHQKPATKAAKTENTTSPHVPHTKLERKSMPFGKIDEV